MNVPASNKFLYFATGDGADATGEAAFYPVSAFRGADPASATTVTLFFTPQEISTVAAADDVDTVVLTVASGSIVTVLEALANEIAFGNSTVIKVDADNSVFFNSNVTDCAITLAA